MDSLTQDFRYAARTLRRSPSFTLVVSLTLALGIGANAAIFSVIDALLLRKPAVADPDRLVVFTYSDAPREPARFPLPNLAQYTGLTDVFSAVAATQVVRRAGATAKAGGTVTETGPITVAMVSADFFATIGVAAETGRTLAPSDNSPVMVVSRGLAARAFGPNADRPDATLTLLGTTYTVVGVLPAAFHGEWTGRGADAWVPITMQPAVMPERPDLLTSTRTGLASFVARLKGSTTLRQAGDAANAAFQHARTLPAPNAVMTPERIAEFAAVKLEVTPVAEAVTPDRTRLASPLTLLMSAVLLVLLIACANVSNLLLARGTTRSREMAVRLALGCGRARLARQLIVESLLLAGVGAVMGLALAAWGADALVALLADPRAPMPLEVQPDLRVAAFLAALGVLTALAFGLAPVLRVRRLAAHGALGMHGAAAAAPEQRRTLGALMIAQIALSTVLFVGAGLFARTLYNLRSADTGFDRSRLVLAWFDPAQAGYSGAQVLPLYDALVARIAALPGVERVTASNRGLFGDIETGSPVIVPGRPVRPDDNYYVSWNLVGDDFFATTGMTLIAGRAPRSQDTATAAHVVAVNDAFARTYFGTSNAVGRAFRMRRESSPPVEIVGVVRTAKQETMRESDLPMIFVPYRQDPAHLAGSICVLIRTAAPTEALAGSIRRAAMEVAPGVPLVSVQTARGQIEQTLAADRATAVAAAALGTLAAVLVIVGLYGLLAYSVECRTTEIGIRTALGATRSAVVRLVLRESSILVVVGLAAGLPLARAAAKLTASRLFGVAPGDPWTFAVATALLAAVGLFAGLAPAFRAARIDPMQALRRE